jgi:hypothetical protein
MLIDYLLHDRFFIWDMVVRNFVGSIFVLELISQPGNFLPLLSCFGAHPEAILIIVWNFRFVFRGFLINSIDSLWIFLYSLTFYIFF